MSEKTIGEYDIVLHWNRLEWLFDDSDEEREFYEREFWKGAMAAGFKIDRDGNYYLSVPRWAPGIPGTVNKIVMVNGRPLLDPYPSREMNAVGQEGALQSVLGWEIDELNRAWFLDQGHIEGEPCVEGAQKLVCWDIDSNTLVKSIAIPSEIADLTASFLNDLVIDNENGFIYIADSGIFTDPLQGGLIVYDMETDELRRVLHMDESTQDVSGYWFEIAGKKVWPEEPMRTGADGIALSADRRTLYWCALTARRLYSVDTALLQDFKTPSAAIVAAVVDNGDKGTNSDGLCADDGGLIYYTMLEGQGVGSFDPGSGDFTPIVTDERMIWVDGMTFDNQGHMLFNSNRLNELFRDELDWENPYNMIVWRVYLGEGVQSYLHAPEQK